MFYYEEVFEALNKVKVDYVVLGGVAVILYGVHRTTMDLDIMIKMSPENIDRLFLTLKKIGYIPKVPVTAEDFKKEENRKRWQKEKNMEVFSFIHLKDSLKIVDIFIKDYIKYEQVKKKFIKVDRQKIPVIDIQQLNKLKKIAGRPKDLVDLDELKRLKRMTG